MKLIKSLTEQQYRAQLVRSWSEMKAGACQILPLLLTKYSEIRSAYVLSSTPDQGIDFHNILVNGTDVVYLSIAKDGVARGIIETVSVKKYAANLRYKREQIKLAVALDLANQTEVA